MFHYRLDKEMYYISGNKIKGELGAFIGIFCKNRYLGKIEENKELEEKYPGTSFSYGFTKTKIFIINTKGIEKIIKIAK